MPYVTITTDVDVDLDEIDTEDLIEELESRGSPVPFDGRELIQKAWAADRNGNRELAYALMREFVYESLNKVV